ncbi:hypothetical protein MPLA_1530004 [Mesorhizobium sp. ORS 3359]|nr:hypothetical protein MPLA_1530004 [Mesorhizobium sp. ORS 3359]
MPRDAAPLRDAPLLREAALRGRASLAALVLEVPAPFAAPPLLLSLSAMGLSFVPLATVGRPHGSDRLCRAGEAGSKTKAVELLHGLCHSQLQAYLPQFLSLTLGCTVVAAVLFASPCAPCGLFGQFLSALEFISPPVTLPVVPVSGAIWSGGGVAGVLGSTVMLWPLPTELSGEFAVWAIAAVARPIVRAEAARILVSMILLLCCETVRLLRGLSRLRLRVEPVGPRVGSEKTRAAFGLRFNPWLWRIGFSASRSGTKASFRRIGKYACNLLPGVGSYATILSMVLICANDPPRGGFCFSVIHFFRALARLSAAPPFRPEAACHAMPPSSPPMTAPRSSAPLARSKARPRRAAPGASSRSRRACASAWCAADRSTRSPVSASRAGASMPR